MIATVRVRESRLIFVEGVIGAGKSTTASFIARQLRQNGVTAHYVFEGGRGPHPIRMMRDLPRPFEPWRDLTTDEYRASVRARWRTAVERILESGTVAVFDGNLFHGNMTDLLLMGSTNDELRAYAHETIDATAELKPLLIYLRQTDLEQAIQAVIAERGAWWERYQVNWKLASPYAERRGLHGRDGLVALYQEYREIVDELVADLGIDTLTIEDAAEDWPGCRQRILDFLGLPPSDDADRSWQAGPPLPGYGVWGDSRKALPVTGQAVPALASYDEAMIGLLKRWQIPGGALALTVDGRLVLSRGYGLAYVEGDEPVQPDTRFRIGSVTKPITATAILKLVEQGRLDLDVPALPLIDHLEPLPGAQVDERIWTITARQLLQHAGGWDRDRSGDPLFSQRTLERARAAGLPEPIDAESLIRVAIGQPLDFEPGTRFAYSNLGYVILGRVIERLAGQTYAEYVTRELLQPLGITRMQIATTMVEGLAEGESHYYDPGATTIKPGSAWWSWPMVDAAGGWIGSAVDLVRFMTGLDGQRGQRLLRPETLMLVEEPPAPTLWQGADSYYGLGWYVSRGADGPIYGHRGRLRRFVASVMRGRRGGREITRAVLFNTQPEGWDAFQQEMGQALRQAHDAVTDWPAHDLFDELP